ncbi:MAG: DNA helicase UvrD, partial [Eggerthellaceae bacterium]|nr:DNA helicase UvrD [Eggerthellaceae bacterium]
FPNARAIEDGGIEEERRLAYVAITRARKRLFLTNAQTRALYGDSQANPVSRFVREIPLELRRTSGVGSAGFGGIGWEKRGSRRGISGSGAEAGRGGTFNRSSAGGAMSRRTEGFGESAGVAGVGVRSGKTAAPAPKTGAGVTFAVGDRVDHKTFGPGVVTAVAGDTLTVKFSRTNTTKTLLKDYAPIVKVSG